MLFGNTAGVERDTTRSRRWQRGLGLILKRAHWRVPLILCFHYKEEEKNVVYPAAKKRGMSRVDTERYSSPVAPWVTVL